MNISQQTAETGSAMIAKTAPPAAVTGAMLAGVPVDAWVKWTTLIYVLLMLAHQIWKMSWGAYKFWVLKKRDGDGD